jgi:hypothetical protein
MMWRETTSSSLFRGQWVFALTIQSIGAVCHQCCHRADPVAGEGKSFSQFTRPSRDEKEPESHERGNPLCSADRLVRRLSPLNALGCLFGSAHLDSLQARRRGPRKRTPGGRLHCAIQQKAHKMQRELIIVIRTRRCCRLLLATEQGVREIQEGPKPRGPLGTKWRRACCRKASPQVREQQDSRRNFCM